MQEIRSITPPLPGLAQEAPMSLDVRLQEALSTLAQSGEEAITLAAVKRLTGLTPKQLAPFKETIEQAEHDRREHLERRKSALDELRRTLFRPAGTVSFEGLIEQLLALKAQTLQETTAAFRRGEESGLSNRDDAGIAATDAYQRGWNDARSNWQELLEQARIEGRDQAVASLGTRMNEAYQQGVLEGETQARALLRQAQEGHRQAIEQASQQGVERGRRESLDEIRRLQEELDRSRRQGSDSIDREAVNRELAATYDRGRRDGWDEAWREAAGQGRAGMGAPRPDLDRLWALAVLHGKPEDTADLLRLRYRSLTKAYHPDRNPDLGQELIRNLNRAKEILGL